MTTVNKAAMEKLRVASKKAGSIFEQDHCHASLALGLSFLAAPDTLTTTGSGHSVLTSVAGGLGADLWERSDINSGWAGGTLAPSLPRPSIPDVARGRLRVFLPDISGRSKGGKPSLPTKLTRLFHQHLLFSIVHHIPPSAAKRVASALMSRLRRHLNWC